jgi:hypothetical protein
MKLIQYQIHKDLHQDEIRNIHNGILRYDRLWHFFHEGTYCLIRIVEDTATCAKLEKHLTKHLKVKFDKRPYEDPHELVRKYQDLFQMAFHAFTVIGLTHKEGELPSLLERFAHCFLNMSNCEDETSALARLFVFRMQINFQHQAQSIAAQTITKWEKYKRENPDEFEKMFAPVQSPKKGR